MSKGQKILIVEDEPSLLNPLVEKFKEKGFDVSSGQNGKAGLEKALELLPDLVLLDLVMPEMDGLTVLQRLRANEKSQNIKVIVLSNLSDVEKASKAAALGALDYIVKSDWKINDIVKRVTKVLA